jgi:hypothetical protein
VPFAAFTSNFSSIFFNAPPPLGSDIEGPLMKKLSSGLSGGFFDAEEKFWERFFSYAPFCEFIIRYLQVYNSLDKRNYWFIKSCF